MWQECTGWPITLHPGADWRFEGVDYKCTVSSITVSSEFHFRQLVADGILREIRVAPLSPINITIDNFPQCCVRTENQDFEGIRERLTRFATLKLTHRLLNDFVKMSESFDVLKRWIFYGKLPAGSSEYETFACSNPQFGDGTRAAASMAFIADEPRAIRLLHAGLGMVTESGEFIKTLFRHIFYGDQLDVKNLKEEMGDLGWYFGIACDVLHATPMSILTAVIRKLAVRYPDKFNDLRAVFRNIEKEKAALESVCRFHDPGECDGTGPSCVTDNFKYENNQS